MNLNNLKVVDNIKYIENILEYKESSHKEGDFYYLQILQRKKENPHIGSSSRVIKNYYINSVGDLKKKYDEIKDLCYVFNARASIRLNKRNYEKVAYKAMVNTANSMANKEFKHTGKAYDRACGQGHSDEDKTWILDVDEELTFGLLQRIREFTKGVEPNKGFSKVRLAIPSKSGSHVITSPFNLKDFKEEFPDIEVHKDNPTNLFIP